jgi:hypothetical protein
MPPPARAGVPATRVCTPGSTGEACASGVPLAAGKAPPVPCPRRRGPDGYPRARARWVRGGRSSGTAAGGEYDAAPPPASSSAGGSRSTRGWRPRPPVRADRRRCHPGPRRRTRGAGRAGGRSGCRRARGRSRSCGGPRGSGAKRRPRTGSVHRRGNVRRAPQEPGAGARDRVPRGARVVKSTVSRATPGLPVTSPSASVSQGGESAVPGVSGVGARVAEAAAERGPRRGGGCDPGGLATTTRDHGHEPGRGADDRRGRDRATAGDPLTPGGAGCNVTGIGLGDLGRGDRPVRRGGLHPVRRHPDPRRPEPWAAPRL